MKLAKKPELKRGLTLSSEIPDGFVEGMRSSKKNSESLSSLPSSPKFSMQMFTDYQDKIREKEVSALHLQRTMTRLEFENSELHRLCCEKDLEIKRISEENHDLKEKIVKEDQQDLSNYWKKEVRKKTEEINKLQEKIRRYQIENHFQIENEIKKLKVTFGDEKKKVDLTIGELLGREKELDQVVQALQKENCDLKREKYRSDQDYLESHLAEIEKLQIDLKNENTALKSQLEVIRRGNNLNELALLSPDIHQIAYQVHQLLVIVQHLKQGVNVSISAILRNDEGSGISSSKQLINDVASLKTDINLIKEIISDYHAEHLGFNLCLAQ